MIDISELIYVNNQRNIRKKITDIICLEELHNAAEIQSSKL